MQNAHARPGVGSGRRTVLISLGLIGLMTVGLLNLWWSAAMRIPTVKIPNPVLPKPNAFDFYVAAGKALVNSKQIGEAFGTTSASYSTVQKEALVRLNTGAIDTVHQGFDYPYCNPPTRSFSAIFPYYAQFRSVTRLLSLQAQARAERGNWSGAGGSCLDGVRLGRDIPYGSPLIGDLVGIACQAIGRRPMWKVAEHLNAAQSRAAVTRLSGIMDSQLPYADTLQEEKWAMQAGLLEIFKSPKMLKELTTEEKDAPYGAGTGAGSSPLFYLARSKSRIMSDLTAYMDQIREQARRPYGLHLPLPPVPADPINRELIPVLEQARLKDVENRTQNGLLLITLALHAFRLEHGHYPAALTELAPTYLPKLPDDPFGVQGTFGYHVKAQSYVLYSVGPDGKDDGGVMIDSPPPQSKSDNPNARYFVNQNSVGDVVAGKNTW